HRLQLPDIHDSPLLPAAFGRSSARSRCFQISRNPRPVLPDASRTGGPFPFPPSESSSASDPAVFVRDPAPILSAFVATTTYGRPFSTSHARIAWSRSEGGCLASITMTASTLLRRLASRTPSTRCFHDLRISSGTRA